jgi:hypothetical protein
MPPSNLNLEAGYGITRHAALLNYAEELCHGRAQTAVSCGAAGVSEPQEQFPVSGCRSWNGRLRSQHKRPERRTEQACATYPVLHGFARRPCIGWMLREIPACQSSGLGSPRQQSTIACPVPEAAEEVLIKKLETLFSTTVTTTGAATGGVAAVPGAGTLAALATGVGDGTFFLTASAAHVLAVASVYGIRVGSYERQRALLLMVSAGGGMAGEMT